MLPATVEVTDEVVESAVMLWDPRSLLSHYSAARRDGIWVPDTSSTAPNP